ncbi:Hsp20/alpha crystallin family protein [Amaricoccus sp.]|uniref:Hsp20/alpha crystallin family protein n=1 Tax=Amaricoccus sp. TaxID=1872485 RepID=UPI002631014C|nr:Hsp20/alpha crystallin family protein [Amaricoccus sp.]HRO11847.1 Hsp20/alpha crystallin family protein [Amaricoccus sp.]
MADTPAKTTASQTESGAPARREEIWSPLDTLRREIDRVFEDFRPGRWPMFGRMPGLDLAWPRAEGLRLAPATDLVEKNGGYEITAELPGLDEKDVEVKVANGALTIRGQKTETREESDKAYHLSERRYGSFQRSFPVPEDVDADRIEASFAKGVLTVTLPKSPAKQANEKRISIKAR